jgi:hypothetical protein
LADRAFRLLTGHRGDAIVRGCGIRATLAAAVLEREGYSAVVNGGPAAVEVAVDDSGWTAFDQRASAHGADFGSLAAFLRGRSTSS